MTIMDFEKIVDKMSIRELRHEVTLRRGIIEDIYKLTLDSQTDRAETAHGKQQIINQIAHFCRRE